MTLAALTFIFSFNGYDSCLHGENLQPWNLWADLANNDCKALTVSYVEDVYDRMEMLCIQKRKAAAQRVSRSFASSVLKLLEMEDACERIAASIRRQEVWG